VLSGHPTRPFIAGLSNIESQKRDMTVTLFFSGMAPRYVHRVRFDYPVGRLLVYQERRRTTAGPVGAHAKHLIDTLDGQKKEHSSTCLHGQKEEHSARCEPGMATGCQGSESTDGAKDHADGRLTSIGHRGLVVSRWRFLESAFAISLSSLWSPPAAEQPPISKPLSGFFSIQSDRLGRR